MVGIQRLTPDSAPVLLTRYTSSFCQFNGTMFPASLSVGLKRGCSTAWKHRTLQTATSSPARHGHQYSHKHAVQGAPYPEVQQQRPFHDAGTRQQKASFAATWDIGAAAATHSSHLRTSDHHDLQVTPTDGGPPQGSTTTKRVYEYTTATTS